jgi:hypothetical protein
MKSLSRRSFLRKSTLAVGAVGAAATVPTLGRLRSTHEAAAAGRLPVAGASQPAAAAGADVPTGGPIVAHVRDVRRGEIDVFVGTRKVTLHDPATAARLYRATS